LPTPTPSPFSITREQLAKASFPHETREIAVRETHLSFVVLTGDLAYKVKKAVRLDFIDATSLERRRELCEEELRLNRRYAAELYLQVVPIVQGPTGLHFGGSGTAIDYAVQMRQFAASEEMHALLHTASVDLRDMARLADRIAAFHHDANVLREANEPGTESFLRKARENLASVMSRAAHISAEADISHLGRWTEEVLSKELHVLRERELSGFVRECHGDLHTGNVVRWHGALLPFDCIEFDAELRFIDVLNDVAFLVMDLVAKDRSDLAHAFLNRYLERTGDYGGVPLLPCYLVYRALVRTKVELIALEQHADSIEARTRAGSFLRTARAFAKPPSPVLVVMHGASGSGKSWLSDQIVPALPAVRIRSDLERKRLAGLDPFDRSAPPSSDIYTLEFNERTYGYLRECARECLQGRMNVIVDAAFLKVHERRDFAALAREQGVKFLIISCEADAATLVARIERRSAERNDPSDADEGVMQRQLDTMEPFAEDELPDVVVIDTRSTDALPRALERLRAIERVDKR
jgi:aminoglycoside phosphotransferase family enzyme/predicted kinase